MLREMEKKKDLPVNEFNMSQTLGKNSRARICYKGVFQQDEHTSSSCIDFAPIGETSS